MSTHLVILNKPFKKQPPMFDECASAQRSSSNVVIYSALASQVVTVAWPTYQGVKITPAGIKEWLRARGLHWSCFCGMTAPLGVHLSSRIVHALSGDVYIFCHDEPTSCEFFLNLTSICESAKFTSDYPLLPKNQLPGGRHDALELINLRLGQLVASDVAPFLKGYCGDFIPGVEQMSSSRQSSSNIALQWQARSSLPNIFQSAELASAAGIRDPRTVVPAVRIINSARTPLEDQCSIIARLLRGEGIDLLEWGGVVETCGNCQKTFLGAFFSGHLREKACWTN